jgi:hypothetical protein
MDQVSSGASATRAAGDADHPVGDGDLFFLRALGA